MASGRSPGKGKSPERSISPGKGKSSEWPTTREEFAKWFWSGTNGNELIKELNCSPSHGNDYIRREKERPTIYGIVLNDGSFPGRVGNVQWKLCNIGFTHVNTATGTRNRMEQVKVEIESKYDSKRKDGKPQVAPASVLFVLPIGAVDVTTFSDTEKRIRNAVGSPIDTALAEKLGLPCSTNWVLTTQPFINEIKKQTQKRKAQGSTDLIDLFKDLKFKDFAPKEPPWVKLKDVDGVRTVTDLTVED